MADSKYKIQPEEIRDMHPDEIREVLAEQQTDLMDARGEGPLASGGTAKGAESTSQIRELRKNIARLKTILKEKEAGEE